MKSNFKLGRRAVLRGTGAAAAGLALPVLDAMLTDRGVLHGQARAATPPVRLLTFFWHNGAYMHQVTPSSVGSDYQIPRCLKPLEKHKSSLLVLTGLINMGSQRGPGDSHQKGRMCFATGVANSSEMSAGGPSIDQFAAQKLGKATRFPSLVISPANGYGGNTAHLAWTGKDQPVPPEIKPRALFMKLFGNATTPTDQTQLKAIAARKQSVLDFVKADAARLSRRLGASDRQRLDAHLDAVREMERRVALDSSGSTASTVCKAPTDVPPDSAMEDPWQYEHFGAPLARYTLLEDLAVMALACDLTRFVNIKLSIQVGTWVNETLGDPRQHHDLSHDNGAHALHEAYTTYQLGFLARLMDKLAAIREGEGTMLDHSLVYASSEISHGGAHNYTNMPVLIGGKGGGKIKSGRHINYAPFLEPGRFDGVELGAWTNLCRLFLSLLQATGVQGLTSWGDADKPLDLA